MTATVSRPPAGVVGRLSTLDRFWPLWILAAIALGLAGRGIPGLGRALDVVYPVLAWSDTTACIPSPGIGGLIEVPVLVGLVYVALAARRWFSEHAPDDLPAGVPRRGDRGS